ncbi:MAG TPA: hypothetical protein VFS20_21995 [Longimicrobium sp.]|nr:hypothetical protein [Longimicrobium sp.]
MSTARPIRLPDRFYLPRTDNYGREVRDVMPWDGAVSYATDGERLGVQYGDGRVEWLGRATTLAEDGAAHESPGEALSNLAADFEGVNLDALVDGIRSYMDLHPVLKTVWRDDVQRLETLRERSHDDES